MKLPENLIQKLVVRKQNNALRQLPYTSASIDFTSNDYIGFSNSAAIFNKTHQYLLDINCTKNGATGSRLISGNHSLYKITETFIAQFHESESALIFNSGYDANVGFFSAVPQRNDVILCDELSHASIRDGILMSNAKSYKFNHNDFEDLERLILKHQNIAIPSEEKEKKTVLNTIYIVTESVFSMDGDCPNLEELVVLSEKYNCYLVIDEAHALGVFGEKGEGLVQFLGLHNRVFARVMTFGKGLGCHGAAVLGSGELKEYLVNFARSFIYTTGLSPHSVATIFIAYQQLEIEKETIEKLRQNIVYFNQQKKLLGLQPMFVRSKSAIQSAIIPGNENVKEVAKKMLDKGFDVKAILSPTVPEGQERLRFCIHSYNTYEEISEVLLLLSNVVY
ncbi:pyridoxal phosphate-dependent aminotransferase family protein [Flavobacterium sp. PL02]|uniref:aminotransferase class I/II-fold pyridoxal phosphate-dependent enzyme n=1 Tax=Flavobacterium sp. PL02 TaxID=3088354 RepID=UPI002B2311B4|nr:pyridoxal phosphate-dependent aminotransferase family protein [Flavobacterium sp. PL02]MEA9415241.1 pyridoxal phosphate-dependent aminotransferase family protein [Flavobacterium sp. PL02]